MSRPQVGAGSSKLDKARGLVAKPFELLVSDSKRVEGESLPLAGLRAPVYRC